VHPPVHARRRDEGDYPGRREPSDDANAGTPETRGDQQCEPSVYGDRRRGVPRWITCVNRQALEAVNAWSMRVHEERRYAVRRRFDGEREDEECCEPPFTEESGYEREHTRNDREHDTAGDDRPDQRSVGPRRRAMGGEPDVDTLVRGTDGAGLDHMRDKEAEADRQSCDRSETTEHNDEENDGRVAAAEQRTEPGREPTSRRRENELMRLLLEAGRGAEARSWMRFGGSDKGTFPPAPV